MNVIQSAVMIPTAVMGVLVPGALPVPTPPALPDAIDPPTAQPWPEKRDEVAAPVVGAKSAIVIDLPSDRTLFEQDADSSRPIASLTKLMTAVIVMERTKLDDRVIVPNEGTATVEESRIGLVPGEDLSVRDLLTGMLVASGNDAARTLAIHVSGSEKEFVKLMNQRAGELGLDGTRFGTASGFDEGSSRSTARELSIIARMMISDPDLRAIAGQKEATVTSAQGVAHPFRTTDALIGGYLPIAGLKTGTTDQAGECLVSLLSGSDRQLLAISLDSPDRFQENKSMLDWSLRAYRWDAN